MGKELTDIFDFIKENAGTSVRLKFAQMVKYTKNQAERLEDKPEHIIFSKKAVKEILAN